MAGFLDDVLGAPALQRGLSAAVNAAAGGQGWGSVASALGREAVGRIEVRSQVSPPVVVDPFGGPPDAPPNPILAFVRPEVRVYDPTGRLVFAVAPYGEPADNYLPYLVGAATAAVVGAWILGSYLVRRLLP